MLFNLYIYIVLCFRQIMKTIGLRIHLLASEMQHASIAKIQEVSGCCKLILMFCANASYKLASCTCFTTLLYFLSTLLRIFVGLALPRPRMYAESHWRYHTFRRYYTCSCSKLSHKAYQKL